MLSYCPWHVIITADQVAAITYNAAARLRSLNVLTSKFRSDSNLKRITESIDQSFEESLAISVAQSTIQRYGKLQAPKTLTWSNSKEFEVLGTILNSFHLYFCFLHIHKKVVWSKLQCKVYSSVQFSSAAQSCLTLCDPMNLSTPGLPVHHQLKHQSYPTLCDPHRLWLLCPWDSPGKDTGVGCHSPLQRFPIQGLNSGLLHCRQILYCQSLYV